MRFIELRASPFLLGTLVVGLASGLVGCGSIEPVAPADKPITDPSQLYMGLTLDHPAVNLSTVPPYNTLQLTATPRNALGEPMAGLAAPTFRSLDTARVLVSSSGLVTAVATTASTPIVAALTVGPVTFYDTARVAVKDLANPPVLANLSADPVPPDSAIWSIEYSGFAGILLRSVGIVNEVPSPRVVDTAGNAVSTPGWRFEHLSLDPAIARFDRWTGELTIVAPGQVRRVVRTYAYGVAVADTVTYTVTLPIGVNVAVQKGGNTFRMGNNSTEVRIAPGGIVLWGAVSGGLTWEPADTVDVTFDDPTNAGPAPAVLCNFLIFFGVSCTAGNGILYPFEVTGQVLVRQFTVPGVYPFRSLRTGATGKIVVTDDPYY